MHRKSSFWAILQKTFKSWISTYGIIARALSYFFKSGNSINATKKKRILEVSSNIHTAHVSRKKEVLIPSIPSSYYTSTTLSRVRIVHVFLCFLAKRTKLIFYKISRLLAQIYHSLRPRAFRFLSGKKRKFFYHNIRIATINIPWNIVRRAKEHERRCKYEIIIWFCLHREGNAKIVAKFHSFIVHTCIKYKLWRLELEKKKK